MKVEVLEPKGYCSGVVRAIDIALKAKREHPNEKIYVFGMLVHNHETINFLKEKGIETIFETNKEAIENLQKGSVLVFTAHGHDEKIEEYVLANGLTTYDATCPVVKGNIKTIKDKLLNGYKVIFIGKKNHPETNAVLSISKDIYLFDDTLLKNNYLSTNTNIFVANQTTLNYKELLDIHNEIKATFPHAKIINEVCSTTRLRQERIRNLSKDVDLVLVVGSTSSNNTMKLYGIAKELYGDKAILLESARDLDLQAIKNKKYAVISSGASTPIETIEAIEKLLKDLND